MIWLLWRKGVGEGGKVLDLHPRFLGRDQVKELNNYMGKLIIIRNQTG